MSPRGAFGKGVVVGALTVLVVLWGSYLVSSRAVGQASQPSAPQNPVIDQAHVEASSPQEAGKYLVMVGSCNDCHTPGWMEKGLEVPETEWLTGLHVGWRGPWGTTYGSNLRLFVKAFVEDDFVKVMHARNTRPPMPWAAVHAMPDQDLRAIYKYINGLKPVGTPAPAFVPAGVDPKTPYFLMDPALAAKAFASTQPATAPAAH